MNHQEIKERSTVDAFIGARVRQRRSELGISQSKLGEQLGITFQQVQKYENGKNRISASSLYRISRILGVDISYFVEGYGNGDGDALKDTADVCYSIQNREVASLVRNFSSISEPELKKRISSLVKAVSSSRELN